MDTTKIFNLNAETQLLGAILNNQNVVYEFIDLLEPTDFYEQKHVKIYTTIKYLFTKDKPISITTLAEAAGKKLPEVGGITYLAQLADSVASTQNTKAYAEIIKDKANMRKLQKILKANLNEAENGEANASEINEKIQDDLLQIKDNSTVDDGTLEKPIINFMNKLQERYEKGGDIQGIKTQFVMLDQTLNGLHSNELMILAARPSMGKSAFASNLCTNVALRSQKKVCLFSLEMSKEQLLDRMMSNLAKVEMEHIKTGKLDDKEWEKIAVSSQLVNNGNLKIYDGIHSLNGIKAECKRQKLKEGLDVVAIDYLQLITTSGKFQSREQEVSYVSRQLKLMSKDLKCTVIALAQLSRAPEQRADHRPMLSDLRESGGIEQDADVVIFLYRDEYYNPETENKGIIETIIAKQRNGELGTIKMGWWPQYQLVADRIGTYVGQDNPFKEGS
jgi:replicative DNA helicase